MKCFTLAMKELAGDTWAEKIILAVDNGSVDNDETWLENSVWRLLKMGMIVSV